MAKVKFDPKVLYSLAKKAEPIYREADKIGKTIVKNVEPHVKNIISTVSKWDWKTIGKVGGGAAAGAAAGGTVVALKKDAEMAEKEEKYKQALIKEDARITALERKQNKELTENGKEEKK